MAAYDLNAMIRQAAQEQGIDPALYYSLIMAESSGNANAVSSKGAMGYAQLMPATAAELGVDPSDPAQNLKGGAMYLRQMLERFKDPKLALAAYNAGPANVEKYNGIPPFAETQNYVSKVLGGNKMENTPTQTNNDPMGSLSKSQRLMLAFSALKDAGMALQGRDSDSFNRTMSSVNEQQDQARKTNAANQQAQRLAAFQNLIGGVQSGAPATLSPTGVTPDASSNIEALKKRRQDLINSATVNPEMVDVIKLNVESIDKEIARATTGSLSASIQTKDLSKMTSGELDTAKSELFPLFGDTATAPMAKAMVDAIDEQRVNTVKRERTIATSNEMLGILNAILEDPNLEGSVGKSGWALGKAGVFAPDAYKDVQSRITNLEAKGALAQYELLKGAGAITVTELQVARDALSRANPNLEYAEYVQALEELRMVVENGKKRANGASIDEVPEFTGFKKKALESESASPDPNTAKPSAVIPMPKIGDIKSNHRYKGGDPNKSSSWEKL